MRDQGGFLQPVERLHGAMNKMMREDMSPMKALHSHAADGTSFSGMGGYEWGWAALAKRGEWAAANVFKGGDTATVENLSSGVSGDLDYTIDLETHLGNNGETLRSLRTPHIFRREGGEWPLVHRHGDQLGKKPGG